VAGWSSGIIWAITKNETKMSCEQKANRAMGYPCEIDPALLGKGYVLVPIGGEEALLFIETNRVSCSVALARKPVDGNGRVVLLGPGLVLRQGRLGGPLTNVCYPPACIGYEVGLLPNSSNALMTRLRKPGESNNGGEPCVWRPRGNWPQEVASVLRAYYHSSKLDG